MKLLSSTVVPKSAANLCALVLKPVADLDSFSDSVTSAFDKIKADADVLSDDVEEIGKTAMADLQQDLRSEKGAEEISDMAVSLFERIFSRFDGKSTAHLETTLSDFNYKRDKACRVLSKYSFLLKGAVQGAAMAAGALPFGGHIIAGEFTCNDVLKWHPPPTITLLFFLSKPWPFAGYVSLTISLFSFF